jgi:hypothetical protein
MLRLLISSRYHSINVKNHDGLTPGRLIRGEGGSEFLQYMVDMMQESQAIDDNLKWVGPLSQALPKNGRGAVLDPLSFWIESQLNLLQVSKDAIENEWKTM